VGVEGGVRGSKPQMAGSSQAESKKGEKMGVGEWGKDGSYLFRVI
jgi:hypothetical protein